MKIIHKYFPELSQSQIEQFKKLEDLYKDWNEKINVVSRRDIDELYVRHVLHSLAIAKHITFKDGAEILDVGTGGGFPGVPLAIYFPNCKFTLVDSIQKKIKVVREVIDGLKLSNVEVINARVEETSGEYDFIVSRAVAAMPTFVGWVKGKIKKEQNHSIRNGIIYLKGGELQEELAPYRNVQILEVTDYFGEDYFNTKKIVYLPMKYGR